MLAALILGYLPAYVLQPRVQLLILVSELVQLDSLLQTFCIQIFLRFRWIRDGDSLKRFGRNRGVLLLIGAAGLLGGVQGGGEVGLGAGLLRVVVFEELGDR